MSTTTARESTPGPASPAAALASAASPAPAAAIKSPAPAPSTPAADGPSSPAPEPAATKDDKTATEDGGAEADEVKEDEEELPLPDDPDGIINMEIFSQIQDMDDDDDDDGEGGHEFSKSIVWGYFEQAENTFKQMEEAIAEPSLSKLSSLGHFLKGSSAALGIIKVQDSCEKMQHYGNLRDEEVGRTLTEDEALKLIKGLLSNCKRDYSVASRWLKRLYGEE